MPQTYSFDEGEGHFHESSGHKKGGKKKEGHSKSAKHHDHFSKKGSSKKGSHHDEDQGHKHEDGHEEHYGHKDESGKKGNLIISLPFLSWLLTLSSSSVFLVYAGGSDNHKKWGHKKAKGGKGH